MHTTDPQTLARHLLREQADHPNADADVVPLVEQMAFAAKVIARETRRAALVGGLGLVGEVNATGDAQKTLDVFANNAVVGAFRTSDLVAAIVSEELEKPLAITCGCDARYLLSVDPLDGSSNIDSNGSVATIFGFFERTRRGACSAVEDEWRDGAELVSSGYVLYGPSTLLVYTRGRTVTGFTLDHDVGEFLVSHESLTCPARGSTFSANLGNRYAWDEPVRRFADHMACRNEASGRPYSVRYSGALVADFHRILLDGGIYCYPADTAHPAGKLRHLYEAAPLAFLVETAGGAASTGRQRVLDVSADSVHQTVPLAIGSRDDVALYDRFIAGDG